MSAQVLFQVPPPILWTMGSSNQSPSTLLSSTTHVPFTSTILPSLSFQISYAIGVAKPLSLYIDTYGTGSKSNAELHDIIEKNFDLRPGVIIRSVEYI